MPAGMHEALLREEELKQFRQILLAEAAAVDAHPVNAAASRNGGVRLEVDRIVEHVSESDRNLASLRFFAPRDRLKRAGAELPDAHLRIRRHRTGHVE